MCERKDTLPGEDISVETRASEDLDACPGEKECSGQFLAEGWHTLILIRMAKKEILALFKNWVIFPECSQVSVNNSFRFSMKHKEKNHFKGQKKAIALWPTEV